MKRFRFRELRCLLLNMIAVKGGDMVILLLWMKEDPGYTKLREVDQVVELVISFNVSDAMANIWRKINL